MTRISCVLKNEGEKRFYEETKGKRLTTGAIYGLDVCQRRPLFATCGTDRSVRVWNYATRHLEMMKKFPEEAYALSFHPGGLQMLVGFSDRLRLMLLMHNDIKSAHVGVTGGLFSRLKNFCEI